MGVCHCRAAFFSDKHEEEGIERGGQHGLYYFVENVLHQGKIGGIYAAVGLGDAGQSPKRKDGVSPEFIRGGKGGQAAGDFKKRCEQGGKVRLVL